MITTPPIGHTANIYDFISNYFSLEKTNLVGSSYFYIWCGMDAFKCLFKNTNVSVLKLIISIKSGVPLWLIKNVKLWQ